MVSASYCEPHAVFNTHTHAGELVFFHGLGNHVLVLNSMRVITDLLEKRATVYSDRPSFTVVGELMGLGQVRVPLLVL